MKWLRNYLDTNPRLRPYYLMWLRRTTKTINEWPEEKFINGVMDCYERHMGYRFDIHNPILFTEKLQWYKVYYQNDDFGIITDKVTFKDYIRDRLGEGYTIPLLGNWTNVKDMMNDWDKLPNEFVLKSNLMANSSGVKVIRNKGNENLNEIKAIVKRWLIPYNTLLNSWDCHFYCSSPKILAEQYMEDEYGELRDYKFFCFDGKVPYFRVDYGRKEGHHATWFNENLEELDITIPTFPKDTGAKIELPKDIGRMFEIAELLSEGFPFVRVDFYYCNNKIYLSEMTFAPGGGVSPYPTAFNEDLGRRFKLPIKEMNSKNITEATRMGGVE